MGRRPSNSQDRYGQSPRSLLRRPARPARRATGTAGLPRPSLTAPPAAFLLAVVAERVHREAAGGAPLCATSGAPRAAAATPPTTPAPALLLVRAGDLLHGGRVEVHHVLVVADDPAAVQLLLDPEHADEANVLQARPRDLDGGAHHGEPVTGEPGRLRRGLVERGLHGFALAARL